MPDRFRVAADISAARLEHVTPLPVHVRIEARQVPFRSLTRHDRERTFLSLATHQKRHWIAHRFGVRLLPGVANDADARFEKIESLLLRVERDPELAVLVLILARTDTEDDAPARQSVHRPGDFRQYPGRAKGALADQRTER